MTTHIAGGRRPRFDVERPFEYENGFYLTASPYRLGRALAHYELYKIASEVHGDVVECGVFQGASLMRFISFVQLLPGIDPERSIVGFDTFGEFPETEYEADKEELAAFVAETGGGISIPQDELEGYIRSKGYDRAELIAGDIRETVPDFVARKPDLKIALLNIDTDIYEPCRVILDWLAPKVVSGGIVAFDDYGVFEGETKLADEFAARHGYEIRRLPFLKVPHYLVVR